MKPTNRHIFNKICKVKRQILPNDRVILFGSQARGNARPDSDWDLLVLLNKPKKEFDDYGNFAYPFDEIGFSYGIAINPVIYTNEQWEKGKHFPFYKNVMKDGIEIK